MWVAPLLFPFNVIDLILLKQRCSDVIILFLLDIGSVGLGLEIFGIVLHTKLGGLKSLVLQWDH